MQEVFPLLSVQGNDGGLQVIAILNRKDHPVRRSAAARNLSSIITIVGDVVEAGAPSD